MKYIFKNFIWILFGIFLHFFSSCKKFLDLEPPKDQISSTNVYLNDETATSAILGIYSSMMESHGFASGGAYSTAVLTGRSSDEFIDVSGSISLLEFSENEISPENTNSRNYLWKEIYFYIYNANLIIENLSNSTSITPTVQKQLEGEAKFVRAFCYFYLTNIFGDVPLLLNSDYKFNTAATRSKQSIIYKQIIDDLLSAKSKLSSDYPTNDRIRPNSYTASALLSRIYLYQNDWVKAELEATIIINNSPNYILESNLDNVFLRTSKEAIWQLMPVAPGINTKEGQLFILTNPPTSLNHVVLNPDLILNLDSNDNRLNSWIGNVTEGNDIWYFPYKYKIYESESGHPLSEFSTVFRLAEIYLIRSEARAHQNKIAESIADLNAIRNRAGLMNTNANNQELLLLAIENERRIELFSEWGHRWFDLKRTGNVNTVLSAIKGAKWQSIDVLYPIPQSERNVNPNLSQNDGY